jgi:hypothetical protein
MFIVQLSSVIFGGAFGAASLTKHCAKRHHFLDGCALSRLRFADRPYRCPIRLFLQPAKGG